MFHFAQSIFKKNNATVIVITLFVLFIGWWALFFFFHLPLYENIWAMSYQIIPFYGALYGFYMAYTGIINRQKKVIIYIFSLGLLFQCIGQTFFWSYFIFTDTALPYPSLADIGFLGSNLFYLYGAFFLLRVDSAAILKTAIEKFQAALVFLVMYVLSYRFFLQGYNINLSHPLTFLLDLGYPLVQATYVSLAIVLSLSSKDARLFLLALFVQYFADFNFLYQASHGKWIMHGYDDVIYICANVLMIFAIIRMVRKVGKNLIDE